MTSRQGNESDISGLPDIWTCFCLGSGSRSGTSTRPPGTKIQASSSPENPVRAYLVIILRGCPLQVDAFAGCCKGLLSGSLTSGYTCLRRETVAFTKKSY